MDRKKEIIKNKIKQNAFNIVTCLLAVIGIVVYFIFFSWWRKGGFTSAEIIPLTADWITLIACILAFIQLIAFVFDSRNKESRSRKEAALNLAEKYAQNILGSITFIENVLSRQYHHKITELEKTLTKVDFKDFTKSALDENKVIKEYSKIFEPGYYNFDYDLIKTQAIIFEKFDASNIEFLEKDKQKQSINYRFKVHISDTMNMLEYFAMAVKQNVAESDMLYDSLHQSYLRFIQFMYPYICLSNVNSENYYSYIIALYRDWDKKTKEIEAFKEREKDLQKQKLNKKFNTSTPLK